MSTLEQLLSDYGLSDATAQTKTAAAATNTNDEVTQVLENLELAGAGDGIAKVANQNETANENKGDRMSLTGIYEELFGETAPAATATEEGAATEKVASEEVNEGTQLFGELTAHYFGVAQSQLVEKIAASLESEAHGQDDEQPMKHLDNKSQLGNTMGQPKDPHMVVNHSGSSGKPSTGLGEPATYSLKDQALKKQILKRMQAAPVGAFKD